MTEPTRIKLARALRASALAVSPQDVRVMEHLAKRAESGEFDDYSDVHVCGPTAIHSILQRIGKTDLAQRVAAGEFDATLQESEEWARSVTDPEVKKLMDSLGLGPDRSKDQ
jgi:hypothetical protein